MDVRDRRSHEESRPKGTPLMPPANSPSAAVTTTNPRTGVTEYTPISESSSTDVQAIAEKARLSSAQLVSLGREGRARMLDAIAKSLESHRDELVQIAINETGLASPRLSGELDRSAFQFRLFAEVLREGGYLEAAIDHAGKTTLGAAPEIRRMLIPIGPVAVFGASNFPFAFSVAGGDTASALAASCPVVIKAHGSHPLTSLKSFDVIASAMAATGAPTGAVALIFGLDAGRDLVAHPSMKAVSFTGSLAGGKALQAIINERDEPIPFYGELSSLNPLVITRAAAGARTEAIARGLFDSVTGSGGQLCTKPGVAFVPSGIIGDHLVSVIADLVDGAGGQPVLNRRIFDSYGAATDRLLSHRADRIAQATIESGATGFVVAPTLIVVSAAEIEGNLAEECFGPLLVIARYEDDADLADAIERLPDSLTATIHSEGEFDIPDGLAERLIDKSGRLVFNGYPTGVRVSWAQHHGGPWPASNSLHTSVGVTAIRRFLRPFAWQNAPHGLLPPELQDDTRDIPRRVDGKLVLPN